MRLYRVRADWKTALGGSGDVSIQDVLTLRDPHRKIPFRLVNGGTPERLFTGGDFDIEFVRADRRVDVWFGEEFGPFLVHTDRTEGPRGADPAARREVARLPGRLPADYPAPVPDRANLKPSNGFEGMAVSADGTTLYPTLEGAVAGDDPQVRRMYEFDLRRHRYTATRRL